MTRNILFVLFAACTTAQEPEPEREPVAQGVETSEFCDGIASPLGEPPTFYESNPTQQDSGGGANLSVGEPAEYGMNPAMLEQAADELATLPFLTSLLVMKDDVLVMERYFNGTVAEDSNAIHSSSKSILAMLVGIAIEQDHIAGLQQRVSDLLPEHFAGATQEKRDITVYDLLTMSAGFRWTEDVSEYTLQFEPDWLQAIVDLPLSSSPGDQFNYSTSQSHLMGAALSHATGMSLCDYAHEVLFEPMGIAAERWGRDPQGYFSGGYNVYMTPRELLKFGQLVLNRGRWDGQQLVSADWVDDAVYEHMGAGGLYHYGYYFWLWRPQGADVNIAWGYGGQLVYSLPAHDLVVVITTNTRDFNPDYDGSDLVWSTIAAAIE